MGRARKDKNGNLPDNLYRDDRGGRIYWRYRRPDTGKFKGLGFVTQAEAVAAAKELNTILTDQCLINKVLGITDTFGSFLKIMQKEILPSRKSKGQPLSPRTLKDYNLILKTLDKQFGKMEFQDVTLFRVSAYLDKLKPNPSNKHRAMLSMVFKYAMSKGLCGDNPAEKTIPKDEVKTRKRLDVKGYKAIYGIAPQWFKNAMDIALYSLQARQDICRMKFKANPEKFDLGMRDNHLYVIRGKVKNYKTAYIRINLVGTQLEAIINRCRDDIVSPYLVHRQPAHRRSRGQRSQFKDHHTQLAPEELSRTFKKLRDDCGLFDSYHEKEKPTFHEIRSLGARLYEKLGTDPQKLLCHSDKKMTDVYLESDEIEWIDVTANLKLTDI